MFLLPVVALVIGVLLSGLVMSVKFRPDKCNLKFSWKGSVYMGMMTTLYLAGIDVFGREKLIRRLAKLNGGRVLIIGDTSQA